MKNIINFWILLLCGLFSLTACEDHFEDFKVIPEHYEGLIPQEGGWYYFEGFEIFELGEDEIENEEATRGFDLNLPIPRCLVWRLWVGDQVGEATRDEAGVISFLIPANPTFERRTIRLELAKSVGFHSSPGSCTDAYEHLDDPAYWQEWQTAWTAIQESL